MRYRIVVAEIKSAVLSQRLHEAVVDRPQNVPERQFKPLLVAVLLFRGKRDKYPDFRLGMILRGIALLVERTHQSDERKLNIVAGCRLAQLIEPVLDILGVAENIVDCRAVIPLQPSFPIGEHEGASGGCGGYYIGQYLYYLSATVHKLRTLIGVVNSADTVIPLRVDSLLHSAKSLFFLTIEFHTLT